MKNIFIPNLVYKFHRIGFYAYSVKFYYHNNYQQEGRIKCLFKAVFDNLKIFNYKYGYYEYLEIPITTKCSLMCKHCSNLIPCYKKRSDVDINVLIKSIRNFLDFVNNIVFIRILGGEPFLSNNLYKVLNELLKSDKIQKIEVVSNGTIIPSDKKVIKLLQNKRVIVSISQYPVVDSSKLISFLEKNNIDYKIDKMKFWMNYGGVKKRGRTKKELVKQYSLCNSVCKSLLNGQLHLCPRSSHATDLGIIKNNEDDYLDLLDDKMSSLDRKMKFNELLKKRYINACDFCDYGTNNSNKIPVAEQINKK